MLNNGICPIVISMNLEFRIKISASCTRVEEIDTKPVCVLERRGKYKLLNEVLSMTVEDASISSRLPKSGMLPENPDKVVFIIVTAKPDICISVRSSTDSPSEFPI